MSQEHYIAKLLEMEEAIIENVEKLTVLLIYASICRFVKLFVLVAARLRIAYTTTA